MYRKLKKILSVLLVIVMLTTSAPLSGLDLFAGKAEAKGVSGYNAVAAVEWAKAHVYDVTSKLCGRGYWEPGTGDCANFVSQCIYMGGVDVSDAWNHNGYKAHYSSGSDGSWIRATQLFNFVKSLGGEAIRNPSASQVEPGDLIFYQHTPGSARINHSAIVVSVNGGSVQIAAHTTLEKCYISDWRLSDYTPAGTYVVKMYGGTCTDKVIRSIDVYTAGSGKGYAKPSTSSTVKFSVMSGEYLHVYEKKTVNGVLWGYTFRYNNSGFQWGWMQLSKLHYQGHYETGPIDHIMGNWYTKTLPTCSTKGVEERVCSRCGYLEQRETGIGGEHLNVVPATCISSAYCTACNAVIGDPLGHNLGEWYYVVEPTCLEEGSERRNCSRCDYYEMQDVAPLGHDYQGTGTLGTCTTEGVSYYKCTRCGDSYVNNSEWSGYITLTDAQISQLSTYPKDWYTSRKEYQYRDKVTKESTSSSLSGWTPTGNYRYSDWSGWSDWQTSAITETELRDVESDSWITQYNLETYNTMTTSGARQFRDYSVNSNYSGYGLSSTYGEHHYTETVSSLNGYKTVAAGAYCDSCSFPGTNKSSKTGYIVPHGGYNYVMFENGSVEGTFYKYRTREKYYEFWQWGNWNGTWLTTNPAQADRDVKDRTTYNVKQSALGHDWTGVTKTMLCDYEGTEYSDEICYIISRYCKRCGVQDKESIVEYKHNYPDFTTEKDEYQLISEADGYKVYRGYCRNEDCVCYIDKTEKNCVFTQQVIAPTCSNQGYTINTCIYHNEEYISDYVDALGHNPDGNYEWRSYPDCVNTGLMVCKCERFDNGVTCDEEFEVIIPALGHNLETIERVEPKCESEGNIEYYHCDRCYLYFSDEQAENEIQFDETVLPALGHNGLDENGNEVWVRVREPKCGVSGLEILYCLNENTCLNTEKTDCDKCCYIIAEREIPAEEHKYNLTDHKEATCVDYGYDEYTCEKCEHVYYDPIGLKEHTFVTEEYFATCLEGGWIKSVCTYCGYEDIVGTGDAIGHSTSPEDENYDSSDDKMELISSVDNECGDGSVKTYQCCHIDKNTDVRCTYTVVIGEAAEHEMGDWVTEIPATCEEKGLKARECVNGDYRETEEILPIGHDYYEKYDIPATCTEPGGVYMECRNDPEHNYIKYTDTMPLGHDMGEWYEDPDNSDLERSDCQREGCDYFETRPNEKITYFKATFIAPSIDGDYVYQGENYILVHEAEYPSNTQTINPPIIPKKEGYIECWEEFEITGEDIVVKAIYELKDSDNESELIEKKEAEINDGIATITLSAFAETRNVKVPLGATPYDIVLVFDQSSSMTEEDMDDSRLNVLKDVATNFVNLVYDSAVTGNVDHRVSLVGFSGAGTDSKTNTGLYVGCGKNITNYNSLKQSHYSNAFLAVNTQESRDSVVETIDNLGYSTGTRSDLGLMVAESVLANNKVEGRERLVIFLTDGVPGTRKDTFDKTVANSAIEYAKDIKDKYDATIYSVGISTGVDPEDESDNMNKYMHYVSSNYPDATSLTSNGGSSDKKNFYITAEDADTFKEIFKNIFAQQVSNTISFSSITFFDTISKYFTLTLEQEEQLRVSLKKEYGLDVENISVTRNDDGTTTIIIKDVATKKIFDESGVQTGYGATISFDVSVNKAALEADSYDTNTDEAGLLSGDKIVAQFEVPTVIIPEDLAIAEFVIDGVVYATRVVTIGEGVESPECDYAQWDVEDAVISDSYSVFTAKLSTAQNKITWVIGDEELVEYYRVGQRVTAPEVDDTEDSLFNGWDTIVPQTMPATDLVITAVFDEHTHDYHVTISGNCLTGVVTTYTCQCGDTYSETQTYASHSYEACVIENNNQQIATLTCSVCGEYTEKVIDYIAVYDVYKQTNHQGLPNSRDNKNKNGAGGQGKTDASTNVIDLSMFEADIAIQPDSTITVKIPLSDELEKVKDDIVVYRLNEDNRKDEIDFEIIDCYLVLYLDHFSYYVITTNEYASGAPNYAQAYCAFNGHDYSYVVTGASVDGGSFMTYTCNTCQDQYDTSVVEGGCDCSCHKGGLGRIWRLIYTILNSLFGTNLYCCPDMDKYLDEVGSLT